MKLGLDLEKDLKAQNNLGVSYQLGIGIAKDEKRAFQLYKMSAEQGNTIAIINLAYSYKNGIGTHKDLKKALELFQMAAKLGNRYALYNIAGFYEEGIFFKKDSKRAFELIHLAASQKIKTISNKGFPKMQHSLALYYLDENIVIDKKRAVLLLQSASIQNDEIATDKLNDLLKENSNNYPTLENSVHYYQDLAFKKNDHSALKTLAFCHQMGLGTKTNLPKAIKYYRDAQHKGLDCYLDLDICFQNINEDIADKKTIDDCYKSFIAIADKNARTAYLLARLYEHGAYGFEQNLFLALRYYNITKSFNADFYTDSINKINYFTPKLNNIKETCEPIFESVNTTLKIFSPLIAEYAFQEKEDSVITHLYAKMSVAVVSSASKMRKNLGI